MRARDEFIAIMTAEGISLADIRAILRDAATVQRLAVEACNRELSSAEVKRDAEACARIVKRAQRWGCSATFNGDPRGACVKLRVPSGRNNDWGGGGWICVPTRRY